jgi:hypothetical protein
MPALYRENRMKMREKFAVLREEDSYSCDSCPLLFLTLRKRGLED